MSRFLECLAITLREETGYEQPVGGRYLRHANGSTHIPARADDRFFSDDPDDTGGRTGGGILQREYDAWRRARLMPRRDVWQIDDVELDALYDMQYWQAVKGDRLPAGIDLMVFDFGVNCGVGTAIRRLQRALGVTVDGHIGQVTLDAVDRADPAGLIRKLRATREDYHRHCRTFWKHGKGWLARTKRVANDATAMLGRRGRATSTRPEHYADVAGISPDLATPPKAKLPEPAESMATSSTGNTAATVGAGTVIAIAVEAGQAAKRVASGGATLSVQSILIELATSVTFWLAVVTVLGSAYIWFERRRAMKRI
jgi:lysozyme family protein